MAISPRYFTAVVMRWGGGVVVVVVNEMFYKRI